MTNDILEIVELGSGHTARWLLQEVEPMKTPLLPSCLQSPFSAASKMPAPFYFWCPQKLAAALRELQVPQGEEKRADGIAEYPPPSFLLAHRLASLIYSLGIPS